MIERMTRSAQSLSRTRPLIAVRAVYAPRGNQDIRPSCGLIQRSAILCAFGVLGGFHIAWISRAQGKDIYRAKAAKAQGARALFTAVDGGIVLHFGRG